MGAALALDVFVYYFAKSFILLFWFIRSSSWKRNRAIVVRCVSKSTGCGCPVVRVFYKVDDGLKGASEKPFVFDRSAEKYAKKFQKKLEVIVRVDPQNSKRTILFGHDQEFVHLLEC